MKMLKTKILIAVGLWLFATNVHAEVKVDKDVSYGKHERNVLDVHWDTDYKNAPVVFTIHGGAFKNGSKAYCSKDMRDLYMAKGCIVVSPNYRLKKEGTSITKDDCALDVAMAVAYIQANAKKYGGDPGRIVATGASAGGYISAQIAYNKKWNWPADAKYKPEKLNIVGWFGNSPYLPRYVVRDLGVNDAPGFVMYGGKKRTSRDASTTGSCHAGNLQTEGRLEQDGLHRFNGPLPRQTCAVCSSDAGQGDLRGFQSVSRSGLLRQGRAQRR
jgi:hypothetical protein